MPFQGRRSRKSLGRTRLGALQFRAPDPNLIRKAQRAQKIAVMRGAASPADPMSASAIVPGFTRTGGYYGGMEKKFVDTALADGTMAATMTFYNLCVVAQGDTESQRVGRKIMIRSLDIRGNLTLLGATDVTNTSCQVRMRIVVDTQTNGAQFAATDLLETDAINSFANLANRKRFIVLKDKTFNLSAGGAAATGAAYAFSEVLRDIKVHKRLEVPIEYDNSATTGAITTVRSDSLWVVFQTSTAEIVALSATARIRYSDN